MSNKQVAVETFIERMGLNAQEDGLPRIAGRMMGLFIAEGGPFSFSELAEKLQISRGSVSTNGRILLKLGVLDRVAKPGDRQDYYELADEPYARMLEGYVYRMGGLRDMAQGLMRTLEGGDENQLARVAQLENFYSAAISNTEKIIKDLRVSREELIEKGFD